MNDTERIDWIIKNGIAVDAPAQDDGVNWVVYRAAYPFGGGVARGPDLRATIDLAATRIKRMQKFNRGMNR